MDTLTIVTNLERIWEEHVCEGDTAQHGHQHVGNCRWVERATTTQDTLSPEEFEVKIIHAMYCAEVRAVGPGLQGLGLRGSGLGRRAG